MALEAYKTQDRTFQDFAFTRGNPCNNMQRPRRGQDKIGEPLQHNVSLTWVQEEGEEDRVKALDSLQCRKAQKSH
jgi:hypothetical protein